MILKNINPLGEVDVPGIGTLERGGEFEVPDDVAGEPPRDTEFRLSKKGEKHPAGTVFRVVGVDEDGNDLVEVQHLGHGLLAQVGNFERVDAKEKAK